MKSIEEEIFRRNKLWEKSTPSERKVLVAKDVLEQLKSGKYIAKPGIWAKISVAQKELQKPHLNTQKVILESKVCRCCAVGSLMLSCVALRNSHKSVGGVNYINGNKIVSLDYREDGVIEDVFTHEEIREMEIAFERGTGSYIPYHEREERISKMYKGSAKNRLTQIMKNIIKNGGFEP